MTLCSAPTDGESGEAEEAVVELNHGAMCNCVECAMCNL